MPAAGVRDRQVLSAGRALEFALGTGDEGEVHLAAQELLRVTESRENTMGSSSGFRAVGDAEAEPTDPEEELGLILAELDVGQTLLAAGTALENAPGLAVAETAELSDALDQLEEDLGSRAAVAPAVSRFRADAGDGPPTLDGFRTSLHTFFDDVVVRTESLSTEAMKGLLGVPLSAVAPWAAWLGELPRVGALTSMGLRAVRRAIAALRQLVPEGVKTQMEKLAQDWWDDKGAAGLCRRLLDVERAADDSRVLLEGQVDQGRVPAASAALSALSERHGRLTDLIQRVVKLVTKLIAPAAIAFAAAAPWMHGAAAAGFLAAAAAAFWIGRDFLDTAAWVDGVDGVRVIVASLTQ
jgi:hypothetical protein